MDLRPVQLKKAPFLNPSIVPPRYVDTRDAALFVGTTAQEIRRYHDLGLLPEPEHGGNDRRYGHEDVVRLLWIRQAVDAGMAVDDIRDAFAETNPAGADSDHDVASGVELRMGLLDDFVTDRFAGLPTGSLRVADLDALLVMERIFGPLGAAVNASRYIALASHPGLREESDRVETAEEALDDTIAVADPRVEQVAAERHAFELTLNAVMEETDLAQSDDALFDAWDVLHPAAADEAEAEDGHCSVAEDGSMSVVEAVGKMPYDFSPARLRCLELVEELAAQEVPAS
jgi:DNA-binding transcriptional MerR regulator